MDFITGWTEQLIIMILIATLLELFLPDNRFQPYIKVVMGLLIILIMIAPLAELLHLDMPELKQLPVSRQESDAGKNKIKNIKSEIDRQNAAYIHKQMAVQLEDMVNKEVQKSYGYRIVNIDMKTAASNGAQMAYLTVYLEKNETAVDGTHSGIRIDPIKTVNVEESGSNLLKSKKTSFNEKKQAELIKLLAEKWGVDPKIIEIKLVKGKSDS